MAFAAPIVGAPAYPKRALRPVESAPAKAPPAAPFGLFFLSSSQLMTELAATLVGMAVHLGLASRDAIWQSEQRPRSPDGSRGVVRPEATLLLGTSRPA